MRPPNPLAWLIPPRDRREFLRWASVLWIVLSGLWFATILIVASPGFGIDGRVYTEASSSWLAGDDPWAAEAVGIRFAAPPPSLIAAAPLTWLPGSLAGPATVVIAAAAAVALVRQAGAQPWWLLSLPVIEGVFVGSLDVLAVALAVWALKERNGASGGAPGRAPGSARLIGGALAPLAKIYALVPSVLLGRWAVARIGIAALVVTAPFLPWTEYLRRLPEIVSLQVSQAGNGIGSPWAIPWLVPPTVVALLALGRRDGAWLVVPALWPASQTHYGVFMIPVGSPILAIVASLPFPATGALATIALAVARGIRGQLDPWSWLPARWWPARWRPARPAS